MLTHVPGYNVTTDNIRSKTVKDSYVKWDAGVLVNAVTTTNSSLTLDNSHDSFYINNANAATISVTILNTINDYTANGNNSLRRVNVIINSRSAASDRTVTFTLPNTFTLVNGSSATRNLYHGNLQVFVVEIVNNTVNIYDGVVNYFEEDSNGDLMPLDSSANLVPRTDLSGQLGTGNKRWAAVYAGNITNTYDSVADMVSDTSLKEGGTAFTKGYHNPNDGGSSVYTIRAKTQSDVEDGGSIIFLDNGNVAELITDGTVNVKQFGAVGDGVADDTAAIQNAISFTDDVVVPDGTYIVTDSINAHGHIHGNGKIKIEEDTRIPMIFSVDGNIEVDGITFDCASSIAHASSSDTQNKAIYASAVSYDVKVTNCKFIGFYSFFIRCDSFGGSIVVENNRFESTTISRYSFSYIHLLTCNGNNIKKFSISNNVLIGSSDQVDNACGIFLSGIHGYDARIENNYFYGLGRDNTVNHRLCVIDEYWDAEGLQINNNTFLNNAWAIMRLRSIKDSVISHNYFGGCTAYVMEACILLHASDYSADVLGIDITNVNITDNVFESAERYYYVIYFSGSISSGKKIKSCLFARNAINMNGALITVSPSVKGLRFDDNVIYGNVITIEDGDYDGADIFFANNKLRRVSVGNVTNARFIFSGNHFRNDSDYSLQGSNGDTSIVALNNVLTGLQGMLRVYTAINNNFYVTQNPMISVTKYANNYSDGSAVTPS